MSAAAQDPVQVGWLGRVPYAWASRLQHLRREAILAGRAPDVLWTLEHPAVVTLGRRGGEVDRVALAARGVEVVCTERGGLATWHGPGQLVGYLLADLRRQRCSVKGAVAAIEDGVIDWLASQGCAAGRRYGSPGVWVGDNKICAVGLHVRKQVTMHGFALLLDPPEGAFAGLVPCGVRDGGVTSLFAQTGQRTAAIEVAASVGAAVVRRLHNQA